MLGNRGYLIQYVTGRVNYCPGCGRSHWLIGTLMAECAFCYTAIPIQHTGTYGAGTRRNQDYKPGEGQ